MIVPGDATGRGTPGIIARAEAALGRHAGDPLAVADPMQAASILARRAIGNHVGVTPLLNYLSRREHQIVHRQRQMMDARPALADEARDRRFGRNRFQQFDAAVPHQEHCHSHLLVLNFFG